MPRWLDFKTGKKTEFTAFMERGRTECDGLFERPFVSWRDDVALFMGPRLAGYSAVNGEDQTEVEICSHRLMARHHEVADGAAAIAAASGDIPKWYRGATARYSADAIAPIQQMGFGIAGYSLNADMGASLPAATGAARIAKARDGDVIIGHINQPLRPSGAGIAAGVVALMPQGMAFVHLPDQIAM